MSFKPTSKGEFLNLSQTHTCKLLPTCTCSWLFFVIDQTTLYHSCRTKWIELDGILYKKNAGLVYDMDQDHPKVGQISHIYIVNGHRVFFELDCYDSVYNSHFRVYELTPLKCDKIITVVDLHLLTPVHIRTVSAIPGCCCIILPHHVHS